MSDCCCHDRDQSVKLVEYTIVLIKRCHEEILKKGEVIYTDDMGDENFAAWVIALYLQEPHHKPIDHADKKYLRVFHRVLETWPRVHKDCCDDEQVAVLRGIREAIDRAAASLAPREPATAAAS